MPCLESQSRASQYSAWSYGNFAPLLEPFPAMFPWREVWAYGLGAILLAASAGLFFTRTALVSAIIVGAYGSIWIAARVRAALPEPLSIGSWYGVFESPWTAAGRVDSLRSATPPTCRAPQ